METNYVYGDMQQTDRRHWEGKLDFFITGICCVVGLGELSLFPLLVYKNGGGTFFIPYFTLLISIGVPTLFFELALGQFSSSGPLTCWSFCPLLAGCGYNMVFLLLILSIYYNVFIAWGFYFFFSSLPSRIPWMNCGNWSTIYCIGNVKLISKSECFLEGTILPNGVCAHHTNSSQLWIWNERIARRNGIVLTYPSHEYFERVTLGKRTTTFEIESISPQVVFCLILSTAIIWMVTMKGTFKIAIGIMFFSYLMLTALVIRGLTLDNALNGIAYFLVPDLSMDLALKRWVAAGHQICFSTSLAYGSILAISSYNKFNYDILRDALIFPAIDSMTGIIAGIALFSYLGYLSNVMRVDIDGLAKGGALGAFEMFPYALSVLPSPSIWTPLFSIMIICIGVNSQRVIIETILIVILEWKPSLREKKYMTISSISFCTLILGLPLATSEGMSILNILVMSSAGINVFIVIMFENIAIGWLYGAERFLKDIETMIKTKFCWCFFFGGACRLWWKLCWKFLGPISALVLIIISGFIPAEVGPAWPRYVCALFCVASIGGVAVYRLAIAEGTMMEKWKNAISPTKEWGPELPQNRLLVKHYRPDIIVYLHHTSLHESLHQAVSEISELQVKKVLDDVQTDYDECEVDIIPTVDL